MSNLCIQVENYVSPFAADLPKIQTKSLIYVEKLERDSYGHWIFEKDATSLIDRVNGHSLTVQAEATIQPIYTANNVKISAAKGNALISGLQDSTPLGYSISVLCLSDSTALSILAGVLGDTVDTKGAGIFSTTKVFLTARTGVSSLDAGLTLDLTKPVFASFSLNRQTKVANLVVMQNNITYEKTGAVSTYIEALAALSFGNSRYISAHSAGTIKFYEGVIHDKALSIQEMKDIAERIKERQAFRDVIF